ncbi:MAG: TolC family protein [Isosphaeraceae bacterium]|nr:TolC family protein [Isosphaeraceae bacterium]
MNRVSRLLKMGWLLPATVAIATSTSAGDLPSPLPPSPSIRSGIEESSARIESGESNPLGGRLVPDQAVLPIDLAGALRMAGAQDLDIAIARARVCAAIAEWNKARVLWLPSIFIGPNWIRHDGQAQVVEGPVRTISKSSLFLGATAAAGSSVSGPVPAGGPAQTSGLTTVLRISDALFEPQSARRVLDARKFDVRVASNDAVLLTAEAYFDLQSAAGRLAIAREASAHAEDLAGLTRSFAASGAGLEADHQRSLAERDRRRREVESAVGELEVSAAEVIRITRIDPRVLIAPIEPAEAMIRIVPEGGSIDDLIVQGLRHRPELARGQALVEATIVRLRQARLRPLIPSLALRYSGGGFGGGAGGFFGAFASRSDADVNLYWELQNLGLADRAIARQRLAEKHVAMLELMKMQDRVAAEVVRAEKARLAALRELEQARRAIPEALASLELNFTNIKRGTGLPGSTRPIEVLQPIQALAQARSDYLTSVIDHNRAQFRLFHALGHPAELAVGLSVEDPPAPAVSDSPDTAVTAASSLANSKQ